MALTKNTKVETNLYEIEFTVDAATFEAAQKVYLKEVKKINVPGFRKGKAPRSVIERLYGKGVFFEDAINEIIPDAFEAALKESALEIVSRPEFDVVSIEGDVTLKAKFYVKPEVSLKEYKGIKAEKNVAPVTDADVDAEINRVRERNGRMIEVTDRAAENGDTVVIDFDGYVDGAPFDGGKAEGHSLVLGSGQFIPGFEDQIVGHAIGDAFDVNVTFPKDYHEGLSEKDATFKVVLHAIKHNELPELDDEFAKDVSEFDTLDEYKADVKANLEKRNQETADTAFENELMKTLVENMEVEIPEAMYETETENFVRDYDTRLRMQGLDLATYFKFTGMTLDTLREQMRPQAERQVQTRLALEKVAELESLVASEEELNEEYENLSKAYNKTVDEIKGLIDDKSLAADIAVRKAVDFVKANAVVAAPAKKTAKKSTKKAKAEEAPAETAEAPAEATDAE